MSIMIIVKLTAMFHCNDAISNVPAYLWHIIKVYYEAYCEL